MAVRLDELAKAQIVYWALTGIWPLVDMGSFQRVTGRKREGWLVRTVSLLILSVVAALATLAARRRDDVAMRVLGATSTGALGGVSLVGPLVGRISNVYLVDALIDLGLCALWLSARRDT